MSGALLTRLWHDKKLFPRGMSDELLRYRGDDTGRLTHFNVFQIESLRLRGVEGSDPGALAELWPLWRHVRWNSNARETLEPCCEG